MPLTKVRTTALKHIIIHHYTTSWMLLNETVLAVAADNCLTNSKRTVTELFEARVMKVSASFESAEPPPAKSERALMVIKGTFC